MSGGRYSGQRSKLCLFKVFLKENGTTSLVAEEIALVNKDKDIELYDATLEKTGTIENAEIVKVDTFNAVLVLAR